jgi:adenine-specific DNA glycosylase
VFERNDNYTPAEAKRALEQLDQLVADETITTRQAGAHRRHIFSHVRLNLKPAYTPQAAKRAKSEIVKLTETGTLPIKIAAAYRAHITKRTLAA